MVVVGAADPVGLARLARGLVELRDVLPGVRPRVVVNRTRPSLGWSDREIRGMVEGFVTPLDVHFLPDDRAAADRALMAGRSLAESGESAAAHRDAGAGARRASGEPAAGPRPAAGSGAEEQVETGDGVEHHHEQQRQLAGELVPPRQQLDRPVVRRDHAEHVPGHDRRAP